MKKICIVSDVIGNRDVIHNRKNGFVCKSVEEFVETIYKIQKMDCTQIIEAAYREILSEYNVDCMVRKYIQIYEE